MDGRRTALRHVVAGVGSVALVPPDLAAAAPPEPERVTLATDLIALGNAPCGASATT